MIMTFEGKTPEVHPEAFIAENASLIGAVKIGKDSSVWFGAVIRGDDCPIHIGDRTSIQDNCVLHCESEEPLTIGNDVTIGHGAVIHCQSIGDHCIVGMGATVLNGAVIGENSIVAAGALVKENEVIPAGCLVAGVPAKIKRYLDEEAIAHLQEEPYYVGLCRRFIANEK